MGSDRNKFEKAGKWIDLSECSDTGGACNKFDAIIPGHHRPSPKHILVRAFGVSAELQDFKLIEIFLGQ